MEEKKFFLNVAVGNDALHHPALCFSNKEELWYLFQDSSGFRFRILKEGITKDFSPADMKRKQFGIYRLMVSKWNKIGSAIKED